MSETKYYRVGAFYKDENSKAVIIQVHDRKEAESWVPRVKAMLYPGEDTAEFRVSIFEFRLQINLNNLNHYRITVERPVTHAFKDEWEECNHQTAQAFDALVEAEGEDDAKAKFIQEHFEFYANGRTPEQYDIYADEVPIEQVIEEEQRMLRQRLVSKYALEQFGDMPVKEFSRIMRREEKEGDMFYKALSEHLRRLRMTEYLEKRLDTQKLSHAEFCKIRDALCKARIGDAFEKINRDAIAKYGKEGQVG